MVCNYFLSFQRLFFHLNGLVDGFKKYGHFSILLIHEHMVSFHLLVSSVSFVGVLWFQCTNLSPPWLHLFYCFFCLFVLRRAWLTVAHAGIELATLVLSAPCSN